MLRAIFIIFFFQLIGEAIKKLFQLYIPGPVIGLVLLLLTLIFLKKTNNKNIISLKKDVIDTGNHMLTYLSLLFVPIGVGVVMHLTYLQNNFFRVLIIIFITTVSTIALTAFTMEKLKTKIK